MADAPGDKAPPAHDDALRALLAREPIFHHEQPGAGRDAFLRITAPDFWQVEPSGEAFTRDEIVEALVEHYAAPRDDPWDIEGFAVRQLGVITWLATYVLHTGEATSRRSTVWTHVAGDWIAIYHQGTPV